MTPTWATEKTLLMCGIVGGIGLRAPQESLLRIQIDSIKHRGPDDIGIFVDEGIGLGMCRLAIVEIDSGRQPASDFARNIHLVWNGEIFNYKELREELSRNGITCRDSSESEVLINLYLHYGLNFVNKLNGMFAIAIFDSRTKSLHLLRDRLGKKPLWISQFNDGTLLFASETRAIAKARPDLTFRSEIISEVMLFGYINSPNSTFNEIHQVPPATVMTWFEGRITSRVYWAPDFTNKTKIPYPEALKITSELIEAAVAKRLVSERPIGAFLSGGYDSTIVTAMMVKLMSSKVQTYSIGFQNEEYNEANFAKNVSSYLGTDHHEAILAPDASLVVEEISNILDQPFADSSIIPTYLLSKFAKERVIVALGGDGGDEVFAGYDRYLATPYLQKINFLLNLPLQKIPFSSIKRTKMLRKVVRLTSQLSPKGSLAERYSSILALTQPEDLSRVLNPEFQDVSEWDKSLWRFSDGEIADLDRMIRSDISSYLPGDLLVKADLSTMANGLELRSPMLDESVVDWGLSLPKRYKIKGFKTKFILKDLARTFVPATLIDRPKMGFAIPRAEWLRTDMREMVFDVLTDNIASSRGWFNNTEIRRLINEHMAGKDRDSVIWPILMLELWARKWLD